jgi:F420-dependent oxidoreductase-like protein
MKLGLQIPSFTWPGGDAAIGPTFARVAQTADEVGFDSIWVMDHFFQIRGVGRPEEPMLEGWTALGYAAAITRRARLGLMVGGIHYRQAGLWAKLATTLDVLAGGRTYFGIGAAWNEEESRGLGFPMPPLGVRFEMLEETLRIVHRMWEGERGSGEAFAGAHYRAERLLNSPQALERPHPPIIIGGGGERKTLRLVAQYADASNVFGSADTLRHKFAVLRAHCDDVGRDYSTIERTNLNIAEIEPEGQAARDSASRFLERAAAWADAGSHHAIVSVRDVWDVRRLEVLGRDAIPHLRGLGEPSPIP